ncbi:MAG: hypothetical protein ACM3ZA_09195 [Bacillota bacterium]
MARPSQTPQPPVTQPAVSAAWVWAYLGLAYLALAVYAAVGGHLVSLPDEVRQAVRLAADILHLATRLPVFRP